MDKKEIALIKLLSPTEVFYKKQYRGYYIRGKVSNLFTRVFENSNDIDKYQGYYTLGIYALVNHDYLTKSANTDPEEKSFLLHYIGENIRNYKKTMSRILRDLIKAKLPILIQTSSVNANSFEPSTLSNRQILQNTNKPIVCKNFHITEEKFINSRIEQKSSIISLGFIIEPKYILNRKTIKAVKPFEHRSYHIFACNIADALKHTADYRYRIFSEWLSVFYDQLSDVFGYPEISKIDFIHLCKQIANLSYTWATTKSVNKQFLSQFNEFNDSLLETDCYLTNFCYSAFDDLIEDMLDAEAVSECEHCCSLFPFEKNKKYCSLKSEGRNCGKTARNKKYYKRHRKRLSTRQRGETRLNRECLKSKGVKK
jgi:hypothetical protein